MFKFFKNIINKSEKSETEIKFQEDKELDEIFTGKFVQSGGIFNYNGSKSEALENLQSIIKVENLQSVLCFDEQLSNALLSLNCIPTKNPFHSDAFLIYCEGLIAFDGSIMISGDQIKTFKLNEIPKKIIIWANTNQFFKTSSEGMQQMRIEKKDRIPSNITCLRGTANDSFIQADISKKIFLLLVEDI